jgi:hypothetical protein
MTYHLCTGIKLDGGKPSMMTMGRIMMDSEVRESAKQVSEALQKAGINFGSKVRLAHPAPGT